LNFETFVWIFRNFSIPRGSKILLCLAQSDGKALVTVDAL